jgi:CelD/BcsL family acetyltransferase involved in cellulose biosynthesis
MQVRVLSGAAALRDLVAAWDELAESAIEHSPFYESWLLLPAVEHLGGAAVEVATVWQGEQLHALMPLERKANLRGLPVRTVAPWRHRHCLIGTPLVRAGRGAADAVGALLDWGAGVAAALDLSCIQAGGGFHAALTEAMAERGLVAVTTGWHTRAVLRRAASAEAYMKAAFSRDTRKSCAKYEKRLCAEYAVAWRSLPPGEDAAPWIEAFLELERSGWKGRAGSALAATESNARFARDALAAAAARGKLRISGIDCGGRPIARMTIFTTACGGSIVWKTAYDEAYKRYSPGILAQVHNIREFHAASTPAWMDSYTAAGNSVTDGMWKDRLVMQTFAVGLTWPGRFACAALPLLGACKRALGRRGPAASAAARALARQAPVRLPPASPA